MPLYSLVPRNIKVYSSITCNRGIYGEPPGHMSIYFSVNRGIYGHMFLGYSRKILVFLYNSCFGCLPKTGHTTNLYNNTYSIHITRHKSTTIHIVFTQQYIVIILLDKYITYNSITTPRRCWCHCPHPRQILPCLKPY
jgi:hypothetical protein